MVHATKQETLYQFLPIPCHNTTGGEPALI